MTFRLFRVLTITIPIVLLSLITSQWRLLFACGLLHMDDRSLKIILKNENFTSGDRKWSKIRKIRPKKVKFDKDSIFWILYFKRRGAYPYIVSK